MADPWSLSVAALALLGQAPTFVKNWQKFIKKWRDRTDLPKHEADESEIALLESRADWLLHKIMLLNLVTAFSKEHSMSPQVVEYCKSERPIAYEEYKEVKDRLLELTKSNDMEPAS